MKTDNKTQKIRLIYHSFNRPTNKQPGPARIGGKYKKAVYRQYTDSTFTIRSPRMESLGLFGPIIRAEVCVMLF